MEKEIVKTKTSTTFDSKKELLSFCRDINSKRIIQSEDFELESRKQEYKLQR